MDVNPVVWLVLLGLGGSGAKFVCPGEGYFPDPESCTSFYRCLNRSTSYKYQCPLGTVYDPNVSNCNHAFLAPPCFIILGPSPAVVYPDYPVYPPSPPIYVDPPMTTPSPLPNPEDGSQGSGSNPGLESTGSGSTAGDNANIGSTGSETSQGDTDSAGSDESGVTNPELVKPPTPENGESNGDSSPDTGSSGGGVDTSKFTVSSDSIYPCTEPGYFSEPSDCREFYTCKEITPGVLSAERLFRCPSRYRFDPVTRLCQREEKVQCNQENLYYSSRDLLVFQLQENQLQEFFSQPLFFSGVKRSILPGVSGANQFYPGTHPLFRVQTPTLQGVYPSFSSTSNIQQRISKPEFSSNYPFFQPYSMYKPNYLYTPAHY
ncbi:uncharacterized protein LOC111699088 [Eurytemora carolleeae]|uniref:uncharacterized protein LOC111699088 n=1 Tax=Eurytemora carolleeae TaxID=1294199 RepID=UPI000C781B8B|nr:uncharacterized protein LOC111699088 [Eurytemora carolleeae]|eukprot:XP_023325421.1 uncharacterized protein LOC111699088 [Eurytemora affinis]